MLTIHFHNTNELYMSKVLMTLQRGMATKLVDVIYVAMVIHTLNGIFYSLNNVVWELSGLSSTVGTGC